MAQAWESPADNLIKAAQEDLNNYEKQAESLTPSKKPAITRILRMLPATEGRLKESENPEHPSWKETRKRLNDLNQRLNDLLAGKQADKPAASDPAASPDSEKDRFALDAQRDEDERNLRWLEKLLTNTRGTFDNLDPMTLQNPSEREYASKKLNEMSQVVKKFHNPEKPAIKAVIARVEALHASTQKAFVDAELKGKELEIAKKEAEIKKVAAEKQRQAEEKAAKASAPQDADKKMQAVQKLKEAGSAMPGDSQLAAEPMPEDAYQGSDKAELLELAQSKWNAQHADKKILAKGIAMRKWDRKTVWREDSLDPTKKYKVDFSSIQVWVITKTDEKVATQYTVEISKDHMKNDAFKVYVPEDLNSSGIFKTHMLLQNVK
ncbi:MAG: hypothetical protein CVV42_16520 [Candidatus Riflebacteria bacterium HGW-Riflebacteria-2]|jgi:hypothetical protein|nr:MAG: hypothetical protein CVV42_16520 [Candidatus Riflebacteria bacterium HGW-Riflebacteria-2]